MDDSKRIVTMRDGYDFGDSTPTIKYNLDGHLGSSNVTVDDTGALVSFEEYYPFGETSFGSFGKKRYRFCGKEKDEESGLYYYGARYYSPWTCRFVSVDPKSLKYVHQSPFVYADNNPICKIDHNGEGTGEGEGDRGAGNGETAATKAETKPAPPKVYQVDKKGKVNEVNINNAKNKKIYDKALSNLSEDQKGKESYILRRGQLVPVSEKSINDLKNLSKANPLIKAGIDKLVKDNQKYQGNFPENYHEEFIKYLVNEATKINGGDYGQAINSVSKITNTENFKTGESSAMYHVFKQLVTNQDYDRVMHFTESAKYQYNYGTYIAQFLGFVKESKDEYNRVVGNTIQGWDNKDIEANRAGRTFGKELKNKQFEIDLSKNKMLQYELKYPIDNYNKF